MLQTRLLQTQRTKQHVKLFELVRAQFEHLVLGHESCQTANIPRHSRILCKLQELQTIRLLVGTMTEEFVDEINSESVSSFGGHR